MSGANHADGADFVITIPDDIVLTGELFYQISYTGGAVSFTGVGADQRYSMYPGLETYCWNILWASATENSHRQIASGIVVARAASSEVDANDEAVVLAQFDGIGPALYWNDAIAPNIGQRFDIGTATLKQLTVDFLATFTGVENIYTVTFWQWDSNYETTVAGTPVYVYNGFNHQDNTDLVLTIPADITLTGDIYYEINVIANISPVEPPAFMTWIGSNSVAGLESYRGGVKQGADYAASIIVTKSDLDENM